MATEIVMPRLGWTMEEGVLVEWLKKDGDTVKVGDLLFSVESDKALNEDFNGKAAGKALAPLSIPSPQGFVQNQLPAPPPEF